MSILKELLHESTTSAASAEGRPQLQALTRAVNNLIFTDLVAIQPTSQPIAALFGVKYLNDNGDMSFITPATYGGKVGSRDRIPVMDMEADYAVGSKFQFDNVVYEVIEDGVTMDSFATEEKRAIFIAMMGCKIRILTDAADTAHFEERNTEVASARFMFDKWQVNVGTRKLKTEYTVELLQDLEANQIDSENTIVDILATAVSEEINKDIIQKLITVSKRYKVQGISENGILDLATTTDAPAAAREVYRYICEMSAEMLRASSFGGTYVLASARVVGLLDGSGWMYESDNPHSEGRLKNGLEVFADTTSPFDYVMVGCKHALNDMEHVGSLFFSPYTESDGNGAFIAVVDPASLQHRVALVNRYALSVNPYTAAEKNDGVHAGDQWDHLAGKSALSMILGIQLPALTFM